jgi:serine/threonine protein kinase
MVSNSVPPDDAPVDHFLLAGHQLDDKHPVERLIAEGGFGVVYYGVQHMVNRPVAIKVLKVPAEFNDKARMAFIEKFVLEAQTIGRISHPNIVQVLGSGVSKMPSGEVAPWMMLEWLTGHTLEQDLVARRGRGGRSPAEALALLRPVFDALAYVHEEGVANRDLKPANVMVVPGKRGTTLKLMDFGIAKLMDAGETAGSGADRKSTRLNSSHRYISRMPSSA